MRAIIPLILMLCSCGNNPQLHWEVPIIDVTVDSACSFKYNAALILALDEWNSVLNGKKTLVIKKKSLNKIKCLKKWTEKEQNTANTEMEYDAFSGELLLFSINFNEQFYKFALKAKEGHQNLVNVMLHEVGHSLGLDHEDSSACVMYYARANNVETLKLCEKEKQSLRKLYGID